jgi:transcriptional regulator with XRE-family HTH domain
MRDENRKILIGRRIKELRKNMGQKQEDLAEKLGIEPRQLSKLETGKHYPSFETIEAFLNVFQIEFHDLCKFEHLRREDDLILEISTMLKNSGPEKTKVIYRVVKEILR